MIEPRSALTRTRRTIADLDKSGRLRRYRPGWPINWSGYVEMRRKAMGVACDWCGQIGSHDVTYIHLRLKDHYRDPSRPTVIALAHCKCGQVMEVSE